MVARVEVLGLILQNQPLQRHCIIILGTLHGGCACGCFASVRAGGTAAGRTVAGASHIQLVDGSETSVPSPSGCPVEHDRGQDPTQHCFKTTSFSWVNRSRRNLKNDTSLKGCFCNFNIFLFLFLVWGFMWVSALFLFSSTTPKKRTLPYCLPLVGGKEHNTRYNKTEGRDQKRGSFRHVQCDKMGT